MNSGSRHAAISPKLVVITGKHDETVRRRLRDIAGPVQLEFVESLSLSDGLIERASGIAGTVNAEHLARGKNLEWVHSWAAGANNDLIPEMISSDVVLTSSVGNGAVPLAEHAMLLMMMLNRNVPRWMKNQQTRTWERFTHGELAGLTVGIFGVGHSGADLAKKAQSFHMRVVGCRRNSDEPVDGVERMYAPSEIMDFVAECDFVVVTAPYTDSTKGAFSVEVFKAMKPTAFWICISRGGIADDSALYQALNEGWIAGAGIDAHGVEPLPADSVFWDAPNTIVTPHNGATTGGTAQRGIEIFAENLRRFGAGEPFVNVVDKVHGY